MPLITGIEHTVFGLEHPVWNDRAEVCDGGAIGCNCRRSTACIRRPCGGGRWRRRHADDMTDLHQPWAATWHESGFQRFQSPGEIPHVLVGRTGFPRILTPWGNPVHLPKPLPEKLKKIARHRARQAEPPAPPLETQDLFWWRRRFRLPILFRWPNTEGDCRISTPMTPTCS
jgi:hypothetical protein